MLLFFAALLVGCLSSLDANADFLASSKQYFPGTFSVKADFMHSAYTSINHPLNLFAESDFQDVLIKYVDERTGDMFAFSLEYMDKQRHFAIGLSHNQTANNSIKIDGTIVYANFVYPVDRDHWFIGINNFYVQDLDYQNSLGKNTLYKYEDKKNDDRMALQYSVSSKISSSIGNKIGMQFGYAWHTNDRLDIILSYNKLFFLLAMDVETEIYLGNQQYSIYQPNKTPIEQYNASIDAISIGINYKLGHFHKLH
jgi:hypothetical protein